MNMSRTKRAKGTNCPLPSGMNFPARYLVVFWFDLQTCGKTMDRKEVCADQLLAQRIKVILLFSGGPINSTRLVGFRVLQRQGRSTPF